MDETRTVTQTHERRAAPAPGQPYLFLAFQCDRPLEKGARFSLAGVDRVTLGRGAALNGERVQDAGASVLKITVPDARMSGTHARLHKVLGRWALEDAGSKNGTFVDGQRTATSPLADDALLELGHSFFVFRESLPRADPAFLDGRELQPIARGMVTLSPGFAVGLQRVATFARSRVPVLVRGESGTGKELIASAIHELSGRTGPFIPVNCGAIAPNLVESELFGYKKGAFSGAAEDRPGLVRSSEHGTLLLDEIGDLPLPAQATLLRVLQEHEVLPVGATRPVKVDLRVVAATHRDLAALADEEKFRSDLLARLDGATVVLPPLRERREDFGLIASTLIEKIAGELARDVAFSADAARMLLLHDWPLNVRELEKCLASALLLARGGRVEQEHVKDSVHCAPRAAAARKPHSSGEPLTEKDRRLREDLVQLLRQNGGNVTAVARAMGKARTQVQRWLRRFEIDPGSFAP
ncbi:MAG TPA: sigma 54-interacting transcriptional regulator [Myxococcales bacterium]|nr:sigma 54-interacting transcriptional regulator [Myxococcales bacterium]